MALLSLNHVSLNLANTPILDDVSWQIQPKERIALVGRNGAGKSTLLKLLEGQLSPDQGSIQKAAQLRIACLMQDVPANPNETVYHFLVKQLGAIGEILATYREAFKQNNVDAINRLQTQIDAENAWDFFPKIETMASHLQLPLDTHIDHLSGGMRRRALLGAALLAKADLLLLDEPTNHLDIQTIEWLEAYIKNYTGTVVIVTHDRTFLTAFATSIVAVDRGKLYCHACSYETYLDRQEAIRLSELNQNQLFDKRLKEEEAWLRQGIKARRTRNEGRVRKLLAMRENYRARRNQLGQAKSVTLDVATSGKLVLEAKELSYSTSTTNLIQNFSCTLMRGDKIGIVGPNGCGKTTLIRLLLGELAPSSGQLRLGTGLNIAYFDQLRQTLNEKQTVFENITDGSDFVTINGQSKHIASYLQDFLFSPDRFNQPVFSLSGGERNRLLLAKLFAKPINLLIMDEPTNDLDLETLELLETMLIDYTGTLLLISHDRTFLNHIVTSLFIFKDNGHIFELIGNYEDYQRYQAVTAKPQPFPPPPSVKPKTPKRHNQDEVRALKQLPKKIEAIEKKIEALHLEMASPDFYNQDPLIVSQATEQLSLLENQLQEAYLLWEKLERYDP